MKKLILLIVSGLFLSVGIFAQRNTTVEKYPSTGLKNETMILLSEARSTEADGDLKGAIKLYEKLLKAVPDDFMTFNRVSEIYGKLNEFNKQIEFADKAIALKKDFAFAFVNRGDGFFGLKKYDEAIKSFEKAREFYPTSYLPVYRLGIIAEIQNKLPEALEFYRRSIKNEPTFEEGYLKTAEVLIKLKRSDEALITLDKLLKINKDSIEAKKLRQEIQKLKS